MQNKITLFLIGLFSFMPIFVFAFISSDIVNYNAPETYFFQSEFDKLVLDVKIPRGNLGASDVLSAISIKNDGTAKNLEEFNQLVLWQDQGKVGFQGMGVDKKLGAFSFYYDNTSWYLNNLNVEIPLAGLRVFVSADIRQYPTVGRYFRMKIPGFSDLNKDKLFEPGDLGIFLASQNNGPIDGEILNSYSQTMRNYVVDDLAPKVVLTNLSSSSTISQNSFVLLGKARDQGGGSISKVQVSAALEAQSDNWQNAVLQLSGDEYDWTYNWQNISEGNYNIKVRAQDGNENWGYADSLSVKADFPAPVASSTETVATSTNPADDAKMIGLQQKITELLALIQNLQNQILAIQGGQANFSFLRDLKQRDRNEDVKKLQEILIREGMLATGLNTSYFGILTKQAVVKFQEKYATEILQPNGLQKGTGFVGSSTRQKLNTLYGK